MQQGGKVINFQGRRLSMGNSSTFGSSKSKALGNRVLRRKNFSLFTKHEVNKNIT